jgi:cadmium resistance protein CadD (predicted permease)
MPAGVALLGVVPLAVGLAYLVFHFTDESRKQMAAEAPSESFTSRS